MPRKNVAGAQVAESDGSGKSNERNPTVPSVSEDRPNKAEAENSAGTQAANLPSLERQITSFTTVNNTTPSSVPKPHTPPRQPVERLASLNIDSKITPRKSIGTPHPGTPEPAKRLKVQPRSAVRRSKEEREATERAEAERLHARLAASGTSSSLATGRGGVQRRGDARTGFGGASHQWQSERYAGSGAAGFLGGATPAEDKRQRDAVSRSRGGGRTTLLSGASRGTLYAKSGPEVKNETGAKKGTWKDKDGDTNMSGNDSVRGKPTRVKREQRAFTQESSDDDLFELEDEGKKIDIERINLISDDEVSDGLEEGRTKERERSPRPSGSSFMRPIRIDRHEHEERTVSVNTEASSLTSAELRRRAKARGEAQGSLFLPGTPDPITDKATRGKGKGKGRDVEFVKNERKWQGVYADEDENEHSVKVKAEPEDDEELPSKQVVTQDLLTLDSAPRLNVNATPSSPQGSTKTSPAGPKPTQRLKPRECKALIKRKPILQTEEDHQEWQRYKKDILLIEDHLRMPTDRSHARDPEIDADGDAKLPDADEANNTDRKHNTVYLFQLPPILPDIEDPHNFRQGKIKRKPVESLSDAENDDTSFKQKNAPQTKPKADVNSKPTASSSAPDSKPIISEPSATALPSFSASKTQSTHALPPQPTNPLPPGRLGSIRLDSTGFPSATWASSFRLDLGRASDYGALQEVVLLKSEVIALPPKKEGKGVVKKEEGEVKEEGLGLSGKKAWAVGQMGGGFVLGPDWGWMFGSR
ncbi:MAG: hypothetical protein Q9178_003510 [Gyalolechia marmorata]